MIDDDRQAGHETGATCGICGKDAPAALEPGVKSLTSPPWLCFGEGWKPNWPQGSGKRDEKQVYALN